MKKKKKQPKQIVEPIKRRQRLPTKEPKSGWYAERAAHEAFLCDELGLSENHMSDIIMEGLRCKGSDRKEHRMIRIEWARETEWRDEGYYLWFCQASTPSELWFASIGPYEERREIEKIYNKLVKHLGFHEGLLIPGPEEDLDWEEDELDWDTDDDEDEDEWGQSVVDELDWDSEDDDDEEDDDWYENDVDEPWNDSDWT